MDGKYWMCVMLRLLKATGDTERSKELELFMQRGCD